MTDEHRALINEAKQEIVAGKATPHAISSQSFARSMARIHKTPQFVLDVHQLLISLEDQPRICDQVISELEVFIESVQHWPEMYARADDGPEQLFFMSRLPLAVAHSYVEDIDTVYLLRILHGSPWGRLSGKRSASRSARATSNLGHLHGSVPGDIAQSADGENLGPDSATNGLRLAALLLHIEVDSARPSGTTCFRLASA
jgi:plasmid stabilization system protein ParE